MKRSTAKVKLKSVSMDIPIIGSGREPRKLRPIFDWHILKPVKGESVSPGGVIIPEKDQVIECEVMSSGPGRQDEHGNVYPMVAKPGDRVLFVGQAVIPGIVDGVTVHAIRDCNIVAVVEPREEAPKPSLVMS